MFSVTLFVFLFCVVFVCYCCVLICLCLACLCEFWAVLVFVRPIIDVGLL